MTSRVTFISPAMSASLRQARFDDGGSIEAGGEAGARAAAGALPSAARVVVGPSVRGRETATALGLDGAEVAPELAGLDVGRWRGLTLAEVDAGEPEAVARWLADPASAPHGGESVEELCARVARWLEASLDADGRTLAVVDPDVVRAAVVHALGAPAAAFWRLDVLPLTATSISGRAGRWNVRVGHPLDTAGAAEVPSGGGS
ncbi:histidine phosphatase family protein [Streptomyces pseudovenezuelae]|uniref:Broad specificity phosphatase PhoE n=1 Tax=Streptomyces pseudovenezuelae TaxID=67350 RepID=A0ABT6LWY7_9ACTN|nr:histidine phosphatase family protein [Streptomyces pseudovenezuelae]MDH6220815.1 broad specificity phosphatase PhoE [Streptomyces pseudovenezuelae]